MKFDPKTGARAPTLGVGALHLDQQVLKNTGRTKIPDKLNERQHI